jgi:hypothetical protein
MVFSKETLALASFGEIGIPRRAQEQEPENNKLLEHFQPHTNQISNHAKPYGVCLCTNIYIYIYIYTSVNPSIYMLGVKGIRVK